jgi:hypothetical protein
MPSDQLKRAIARVAFKPFQEQVGVIDALGHPVPYEPTKLTDLALAVEVRTDHGPRLFEIRVKELM